MHASLTLSALQEDATLNGSFGYEVIAAAIVLWAVFVLLTQKLLVGVGPIQVTRVEQGHPQLQCPVDELDGLLFRDAILAIEALDNA
jgi:hypothetical protein